MAIIPLKQTITVTKPGVDTGWGHAEPGEVITLKARVVEETNVVKDRFGREAISSMTVILEKLANVSYDDVITYTNELGLTVSRSPLSIEPLRNFSGRALLTKVYV